MKKVKESTGEGGGLSRSVIGVALHDIIRADLTTELQGRDIITHTLKFNIKVVRVVEG